jgi:T4 RnlA family RNA ligase
MNLDKLPFAKKEVLDSYVDRGLLARREEGELVLYNYTPKCAFSKAWDDVTLNCRGLILDRNTKEVIARPFPKFFNLEEWEGTALPTGPVEVYDKADGSLFIAVNHRNHGLVTATRGSFSSDQAKVGRTLVEKLPWFMRMEYNHTYLFEVIYPENKIVVDYGSQRKLVLLGIIDNITGMPLSYDDLALFHVRTGVELVQRLHTLPNADTAFKLKQLVKENTEGFVLLFEDGRRIKIKGEEYLRLHKIVTNTNNKTVWEIMSTGGDRSKLLENVPDEFMRWVERQMDYFLTRFNTIESANVGAFRSISELPRPQFAQEVRNRVQYNDDLSQGILFRMKDDKNYHDLIWKMIKPITVEWPSNEVE